MLEPAAAGPAVRAAVFGRAVDYYSSILANGLVLGPPGGRSSAGWRPISGGTARPAIDGPRAFGG
jgi:hypothetical protein